MRMESSDGGQLVVFAGGQVEGASLRPAGEASGQWRNWPFGRLRRAKMERGKESSSSVSPFDSSAGDQEQDADEKDERWQQRECSRHRDNNNEATGGAQISIGERLRFSLLSKRTGTNDGQHLLSRRDKLAAGNQSSSSSGHAKKQQQQQRQAIVTVASRGGAKLAAGHSRLHNNGSASRAADNHEAARESPPPPPEDDSNSKILFRQYLPSCSFKLNDHTPRESNNKFNATRPSSSSSSSSSSFLPSQTEATRRRACEFVHPKRAGEKGEGGVSEQDEDQREEEDDDEQTDEAAAQVDDEKINFARTKQRQEEQRCQWTDKSSSSSSGNNELDASQHQRAGPDSTTTSELSGAGRERKRADVVKPSSSLAKSIASAWSRFKISPNRRKRSNQRSSLPSSSSSACKRALLLNNNNYEREEDARCEQQQVKTGARERCKQSVLEIRRRELEVLKLRQQLEQSRAAIVQVPVKRKGFLNSKQESSVVLTAGQATTNERPQTNLGAKSINFVTRNKQQSVRPKLAIDLNNNLGSANTSLASNFNQRLINYGHQLLSRRSTRESDCLLEEEEELEVEDLEEPKMSILRQAKEEAAGMVQRQSKKMSVLISGSSSSKTRKNTKAASRGSGGANSLLVAATTAIWLFLVLAGAQLVLGQQSPPFTRSQRPQTSPVGPGPPPLPMPNPNLPPPPRGSPGGGGGGGGVAPLVAPATGSLVANISCNKIRGHVTLTPNLEGGTTVTTQITAGPPGEVYQWSIHQFPIKPGAAMCTCSSLILGSKLVDLGEMHGNLPSDQEFSVQSSLQLFDFDSPVGHSLLLRGIKTGMVACGTFLPTNRKSNYRAKFHMPLSGSVTIFQTAFGTSFLSHLMYSNGTRRHSTHRFDLVRSEDDVITSSLLTGGQQVGGSPPPPARSNIEQLEQREHENELQACRRFSSGEPLFKNLTYQLSVSTENFGMRGRTALVLPQIPFETFSSVYVVVYSEYDPNEPIACAPLRFVKPKTAAAKFQTNSVQGNIVFTQDSPYDVTVARVNLNFPNSDGHSYGIDELPMIIRRKSDTRVCPNIREIIYNPHHIEPSSVPAEGEATSDQYAVGDLSGKYGSLTGKATERITAADHNLPLFGPVSIIGRALTIYSAEGVAIACSNVELTTPMTTAFATFDYGIQGQFIFRQPMNDCNGDTYVYIEVSKPNTPAAGAAAQQEKQQQAVASLANGGGHEHSSHMQTRSLDHNWHIHVNPVDSGVEHLSTTECSLAGAHYNPYNTSTATIYSRDCTPFNVLRCELGDLSSKMFTIEIPPYKVKSGGQEPDIGKFFGTDIELPLCGPTSIVNRSVVVHVADFGTQRLACSTVIEFKPRN